MAVWGCATRVVSLIRASRIGVSPSHASNGIALRREASDCDDVEDSTSDGDLGDNSDSFVGESAADVEYDAISDSISAAALARHSG